jgi:hypothetical protein
MTDNARMDDRIGASLRCVLRVNIAIVLDAVCLCDAASAMTGPPRVFFFWYRSSCAFLLVLFFFVRLQPR